MKRYIADNIEVFNSIVAELTDICDIRELKDNYIQTDCGIHAISLGHNIIEPATHDEDGNELTSAVFSTYVMIDILGEYSHEDLTEVFPLTPIHQFS